MISDSVSRANSTLVGEGTATSPDESSVSDPGQAMSPGQGERTGPTIEDLRRLAPAGFGRSMTALPRSPIDHEHEQSLPWVHSSSNTQTVPSRLTPIESIPARMTSRPRVEPLQLTDHVYSAAQVETHQLTDHVPVYLASIERQSAISHGWPSSSSVEMSVTAPVEAQTVPGVWPQSTRSVDPVPSTATFRISGSGNGLAGSAGRGWQRATSIAGSELLHAATDRLLPIKF